MGDNSDGSSLAAQRAQSNDVISSPGPVAIATRPGFFSRVFGVHRTDVPELVQDRPHGANHGAMNGAANMVGLLNLRRMRLDDVAIPRAEIKGVPVDIALDDLVEHFRQSGLTRLPVYEGTLDNPVGMAHLKDVALKAGFNGGAGDFDLSALLRPLIYAPPSMPIGVLLQKMQTQRIHMALVIDEYGGVDGLVTIEDLIEQVIGEIEDEHDQEEGKYWRQEKPGCYLALARTPLDEFEAETGLHLSDALDEDEVDTLGGVVFVLTGRVPARGEMVRHPAGVEFEVVDADPRRIKRLRVRVPGLAGPAE